jgi:hypothetical protein
VMGITPREYRMPHLTQNTAMKAKRRSK